MGINTIMYVWPLLFKYQAPGEYNYESINLNMGFEKHLIAP